MKNLVEGLTIMMDHGVTDYVSAEHDVIYAGGDAHLDDETKATLESLGWHYDEIEDRYYYFT